MRQKILESVVTAAILGILGAAVSTYIEVRLLRHDVNELRKDLDGLWAETSEQVQTLTPDKPKHRRQ